MLRSRSFAFPGATSRALHKGEHRDTGNESGPIPTIFSFGGTKVNHVDSDAGVGGRERETQLGGVGGSIDHATESAKSLTTASDSQVLWVSGPGVRVCMSLGCSPFIAVIGTGFV